jgi:L-lactate dehydrogenase complex protein LldG
MGKAQIFARIRASLHRQGELPESVQLSLKRRLKDPQEHVRPNYHETLRDRLKAKVEGVSASLAACTDPRNISAAVVDYLEEHNLPREIVVSDDTLLADVNWSNQLTVKRGLPSADDLTSVTAAIAAIAETGTMVLLSTPESPTTLNLLPENHIVAVRQSDIVRHQEDVWSMLRTRPDGMPRTVNLITGPSRTGDVEQVLQLGAHGPRQLHVLVVEDV